MRGLDCIVIGLDCVARGLDCVVKGLGFVGIRLLRMQEGLLRI